MRAFLLSAGLGSRLRPITDTVPKCMVEIAGRPMIDLWLDALAAAGVDEVLVNTHHLAEVVEGHLARRRLTRSAPAVVTSYETELLGSAGTLRKNGAFIEDDDFFLVCHADNLTDFDLRQLIAFHHAGDVPATLAVFHAERPSDCGIVELDGSARIVGFEEKPARPKSDLANAGMYAFAPEVIDMIEGDVPLDIGFELLPRLVGRARALPVEGYFLDIGTVEAYERAQAEWQGARQR